MESKKELFATIPGASWRNAKKAFSAFADGKNPCQVWHNGRHYVTDAAGAILAEDAETPVHPDAVIIRHDMTAEEMKAAHVKAAMRATIRPLEEKARAILAKGDAMTDDDRRALLEVVNVAYHSSGKIETIYSIDSTSACAFCADMRKAAACNPLMICRLCYAAADSWKEAAGRRHKLNALILSSVLFTSDELKALAAGIAADVFGPARVRINDDGDTVNETHGRNYIRFSAAVPGANIGYWYKNRPAVEKALDAEGIRTREQLPHNIRFIHSSPLIGFPAAPTWFDDGVFTVFPDKETTEKAIAAGAFPCNGRKCKDCGFHCYRMTRGQEAGHIAEVLRAGKKERAEVMEAYQARKAQEAAPATL